VIEDVGYGSLYGVNREWHGFTNPCGLVPRVPAGVGTGCNFVSLAQPAPVTRV
jgi:hypothetical protein